MDLNDRDYLMNNLKEWRDVCLECHDESVDPKTNKKKNTHKFYVFHVDPASTQFGIEYGRIGKAPNVLSYPRHMLGKKFQEKLNKGYRVIRVVRHDEKSLMFADFVEKFLGGGEESFLPE